MTTSVDRIDVAGAQEHNLKICGLGLNWVIFNMFIGLVKSGTMADALTRSILDVVVVAAAMGLAQSVGGERQAA